jgi:quinol monooxygenase YgiN
MLRVALLVRLHALRGREEELAAFLQAGLPLVHAEHETPLWLALRFGPCSFGIFDAFSNDEARQAHLAGRLAAALFARAPELLAAPPQVEMVDILASKLVALTPPTA